MSLYSSTQRLIRIGFWFFYHRVHILNIQNIPADRPVLLVPNHPNSFMDALIAAAYLPRPTYFLTRGDAFKNPILAKLLRAYCMLPVYRISEGKENIGKNLETFDASYDIVNKRGVVLIFGEGLCVNNWDLRPLKKGPARIANQAWTSQEDANELVIVPVGLTYEHFDGGGKSVIVNYGKPITKDDLQGSIDTPYFINQLNDKITSSLAELAYVKKDLMPNGSEHNHFMKTWKDAEKKSEDILQALKKSAYHPSDKVENKRWFTRIHATLFALPHYWMMAVVSKKLTRGTVFYDSILFGFTLFLFPLYAIIVLVLILYFI